MYVSACICSLSFVVSGDVAHLTSVGLKGGALLFQKSSDFFVVGDNAIMHNSEFTVGIGSMGV